MAQLLTALLQTLGSLPAPLIYFLVAVWVGMESAGIGVPIEPVMLFAGSIAAQPTHPIVAVVAIAATVGGCALFATVAYDVGNHVGTQAIARVGHVIGLSEARAEHIEFWLRQRGFLGIVIARVTPVVRTFGSYVMGAADIPFPQFIVGTVVGSTIYCGFWILLGSVLGQNYERALQVFGQYQNYLFALAALVIVGYIVVHHVWGEQAMHRMAMSWERNVALATERAVAVGKVAGKVAGEAGRAAGEAGRAAGKAAGKAAGGAGKAIVERQRRTSQPKDQ